MSPGNHGNGQTVTCHLGLWVSDALTSITCSIICVGVGRESLDSGC